MAVSLDNSVNVQGSVVKAGTCRVDMSMAALALVGLFSAVITVHRRVAVAPGAITGTRRCCPVAND